MLAMLATAIPLFIIAVLGLYYSIGRRNVHPKASTYAAVGFGLVLLQAIQIAALSIWIRSVANEGGVLPPTVGAMLGYLNMAGMIINWIALGLIARAVFVDRSSLRSATLGAPFNVPG